jgi:hypothetical protein
MFHHRTSFTPSSNKPHFIIEQAIIELAVVERAVTERAVVEQAIIEQASLHHSLPSLTRYT